MTQKLSVVIPAYNEENFIAEILDRVLEVDLIENIEKEVIVVDDCSCDGTVQTVEDYINEHPEADISFFSHDVNRGKGASLRTGIREASGDFLIVQDADLEYDPAEYNLLLRPILDNRADVVYGSRFIGGRPHRVLFFWHTIGNKLLTSFSNLFTNLNLTDMETCYKLFRSDVIKSITVEENRFGFEPEVTAKISRIPGIRVYEVGISYYGRTYAEGKKINWKDGISTVFCILKYNLLS